MIKRIGKLKGRVPVYNSPKRAAKALWALYYYWDVWRSWAKS